MAKNVKGVEINREEMKPFSFFMGFVAIYMVVNLLLNYILQFVTMFIVNNEVIVSFFMEHGKVLILFDIIKTVFSLSLVIFIALKIMFRYFKLKNVDAIKRTFTYYFLFYILITVLSFNVNDIINPYFITQCVGLILFPTYFGFLCIRFNNEKDEISSKNKNTNKDKKSKKNKK